MTPGTLAGMRWGGTDLEGGLYNRPKRRDMEEIRSLQCVYLSISFNSRIVGCTLGDQLYLQVVNFYFLTKKYAVKCISF